MCFKTKQQYALRAVLRTSAICIHQFGGNAHPAKEAYLSQNICTLLTFAHVSIFDFRLSTLAHMRLLFSALILCATTLFGTAQTPNSETFPDAWSGLWTGTLDIFGPKGKVQSVAMEVEIAKLDTSKQGRYVFSLVYGGRDKDYRPYELVPVDTAKGIWRVDEKNSIVMESYLRGPKLLCWFVVSGNRILTTYEKTGDTMTFEVVAGKESPVSTTGNTKQGEEEIPEVKTYPASSFQRAILRRKG